MLVDNTIEKSPGDALLRFTMDFSSLPELAGAANIASVTSVVASPTGPTIAGIQIDTGGKSASALFSGGVDGTDYAVTYTVLLSTGQTIVRTGILQVRAN